MRNWFSGLIDKAIDALFRFEAKRPYKRSKTEALISFSAAFAMCFGAVFGFLFMHFGVPVDIFVGMLALWLLYGVYHVLRWAVKQVLQEEAQRAKQYDG